MSNCISEKGILAVLMMLADIYRKKKEQENEVREKGNCPCKDDGQGRPTDILL